MSHTFRVVQGRTVEVAHASTDPLTFQLECVEAFVTSRVVRGFSAVTIENETGELERMLAALGKPVWEATADDVDRVVGAMAADGLLASTRRRYVQALSSFHRFLITRRAGEIEASFAGFPDGVESTLCDRGGSAPRRVVSTVGSGCGGNGDLGSAVEAG